MSRIYKIGTWTTALLLLTIAILVIISPYGKKEGFDYRLVKHTVHIKASADAVFKFLGNSGNAKQWSVFVDHISTLNADSIKDGMPGSRRKCFCKADETGKCWDEVILLTQPATKRRISCYRFKEFYMTVDGIATEQLYEALPDATCNLTFTFFIDGRNPNLLELSKLYIGAFTLHSIFKRNLENVKAICEGKKAIYQKE